jgi:hypothetical protein
MAKGQGHPEMIFASQKEVGRSLDRLLKEDMKLLKSLAKK